MGLERGAFAFGAADYPLAATTDPMLAVADPAVYHATKFLAWALHNYMGAALAAYAAKVGLVLPNAVAGTAAIEPTPFLLQDHLTFPLLCVYRKKDVWDEHTIAYDKSTATWEFAYVLPPLVPQQANALTPVLRAASAILRRAIHMGWDPGYNAGEIVWHTAGLQKARLADATYGAYARIDKLSQYYRTLVGTIVVLEREMPRPDQYDAFAGADAGIDLAEKDDAGDDVVPILPDVVDASTYGPPTLASLDVATGSAAGGTTVTITGGGFRPGTRPTIFFGGAQADAATVVDATHATCVTSPHDAFPTALVDVTYVAADGQSARLPDAYTYTTP